MKLRNKKTGDIGELQITEKHCGVVVGNGTVSCGIELYSSLTELNADWEDYEEPQEYWYIDIDGIVEVNSWDTEDDIVKGMRTIGNYFETREEAEKAVEKLKAWKLLKDECKIKFDGIIRDDRAMLKAVKISYDRHEVTLDRMRECMDALHLLFGGEQ